MEHGIYSLWGFLCSLLESSFPESGFELRCEKRELSMAIPELFRGDTSPPPVSLSFPLFDGEAVQLKALRHQSMGRDQGVVMAKADGESEGGHVLLSYVGTALAGTITLKNLTNPSLSRTFAASDTSQVTILGKVLTLDPIFLLPLDRSPHPRKENMVMSGSLGYANNVDKVMCS